MRITFEIVQSCSIHFDGETLIFVENLNTALE